MRRLLFRLPNAALMMVALAVCAGQDGEPNPTAATRLPIELEQLTEAQKAWIRQLHESDKSTYLIDTRPVLFQIQGVTNAQQQSRGPVTLERPVDVMIYCLGEIQEGLLVDLGWIVDAATGKTVWQMEPDKTVPGGRQDHLRKQVARIRLPAGSYTLNYRSNESTAVGDWQHGKPEREFYYGITVFNLAAIATIRNEFRKIGLPLEPMPQQDDSRGQNASK